MSTKPESKILETFHKMISISIDAKGVYPQHAIVLTKEDKTEILALALDPADIYGYMSMRLKKGDVAELVFGLDRYVLPGQGCEFNDVITVQYWDGAIWRIGVINYLFRQGKEPIVREIDWDNKYWIDKLLEATSDLNRKG